VTGIRYWDRDNNPIDGTLTWATKFEDPGYRIVAIDRDDADPMLQVSTIWLGFDQTSSFLMDDEPGYAAIFETLVRDASDRPLYREWAATEAQALAIHRAQTIAYLGREPRDDGLLDQVVRQEREAVLRIKKERAESADQ